MAKAKEENKEQLSQDQRGTLQLYWETSGAAIKYMSNNLIDLNQKIDDLNSKIALLADPDEIKRKQAAKEEKVQRFIEERSELERVLGITQTNKERIGTLCQQLELPFINESDPLAPALDKLQQEDKEKAEKEEKAEVVMQKQVKAKKKKPSGNGKRKKGAPITGASSDGELGPSEIIGSLDAATVKEKEPPEEVSEETLMEIKSI